MVEITSIGRFFAKENYLSMNRGVASPAPETADNGASEGCYVVLCPQVPRSESSMNLLISIQSICLSSVKH